MKHPSVGVNELGMVDQSALSQLPRESSRLREIDPSDSSSTYVALSSSSAAVAMPPQSFADASAMPCQPRERLER